MKYNDLLAFGFEIISDIESSKHSLPVYVRESESNHSRLSISLESTIIDQKGYVKSGFFKFAKAEDHLTTNIYLIIFMLEDKSFMHLSDAFSGVTLLLDYEREGENLIKEIVSNYIQKYRKEKNTEEKKEN